MGTPDPENAYIEGGWLSATDNGHTKSYLWANRDRPNVRPLYDLSFGKRPAEELYDVEKDPYQLKNVAADPDYADARRKLAGQLREHLRRTEDPRELGTGDRMDEGEYLGVLPRWPGQEVIDRYRQ